MLTDEQLRRICVKPNLPEANLVTLPDTYQWAPVLRSGRKHMSVAARVMGLQFCPGAIFTGPEGNGRHTTAYALAKTLCADKDGYRSLISIHGDDLDFEDREDIYAVVGQITRIVKMSTAMVLILDRPDLSKHNSLLQRTMLRLQQTLLEEKLRLYLIVIADSAEDVCGELLSCFPRYHCPRPDRAAVKKWVKKMLREPVPIHIEGINEGDLAAAAEGLSWKQLRDLHQNLLRLMVLQYAMNKKKYDAKGLAEEQVYLEGKIKLSHSAVQMILDSTADQKYTTAAAAPVAAYYGGPVMPMQAARTGVQDLGSTEIPNLDDDPDPIAVSDFTRLVQSMHQLTVDDDGSDDDLF